jgi:pimeloyl-ACP methyl ester carboxylesterase
MKKQIALLVVLVLVVIYALGPSPETPVFNVELPALTSNLVELQELVSQLENRPDIKPGNEARIFWANDTIPHKTAYVLLYLHGFSASRKEGEPVYQDFAKRYGMNTFAARLATQGLDTVDQMIDYRPERLWESAKQALAIAEKLGNKVIIMSTSTGGTLALKLAATYPDKVHALINMSPNIRVKDANAWLLNKPWGLQIARIIFGSNFRHVTPTDSNYHDYWYVDYRLESVVYLQELVESTMNSETFEEVDCPVLTLYYYKNKEDQDPVVSVDRILWMHKNLATAEDEKRAVAIPDAQTHVIGCGLYSKALPEVEQAIFSFADEVLQLEPVTLQP